jgi:hypothetical protein
LLLLIPTFILHTKPSLAPIYYQVGRLKPEGFIELVIEEFRHFVEAAAGDELVSAPVHIRGLEWRLVVGVTSRLGIDSLGIYLEAECPADDNNGT